MSSITGRPPVWDVHADEMRRLYCEEGLSRGEVARKFETSVQTVTRQLRRLGIDFSARSSTPRTEISPERRAEINAKISANRKGKATGPRVSHPVRLCEREGCEKETTNKRFCSRLCRNVVLSRANRDAAREVYEEDPQRCPCGVVIPFEYRHTRQFCSPDHRSQYSIKRQPNPDNHVTFNCERCGKEVTRNKNYGNGANRFCSNECSARSNTQRRVHLDDVSLDSGYEALVWGLATFRKVPIGRFDRDDCMPHGDGWYGPDFVIGGVAVEVKGHEDDDDRSRYEAWRAERGLLAVLGRSEVETLLVTRNAKDFVAELHRMTSC